MKNLTYRRSLVTALSALFLAACGGGSSSFVPPPPPAADITVSGNVYDGPVTGGTLFVFAASGINAALDAANNADDRTAALRAASPLLELARDPADADSYTIAVSGDLAGQALFLVLDTTGAVDAEFGDQPPTLEAVVVAGDAGGVLRVNITPHPTLASVEVRNALDPDGDGTVIGAAAIQAALDVAMTNATGVFGTGALGEDLFPGGEDPRSTTNLDILAEASSAMGLVIRTAAAYAGLSMNDVLALLAADAADGTLDASAPLEFNLSAAAMEDLLEIVTAYGLGRAAVADIEAVSCAGASTALRRACEFEVLDEFFIGAAICAHSESEAEADLCIEDYVVEREEALDECGAVTDARLQLCTSTADAVHNPPFGASFQADFVDPLTIGDPGGPAPHPYLPLTQGSTWVYEGTFTEDGEEITETITVTVTDRIKLVDGIRCLVVRDVVEIDGELVEDTDDWFAQDVSGNIWYCGEEVKDYETFDGDAPPLPQLVAIDGSFKAGRDGDEAGILLPAILNVGDIYRQEVSFTNAEDVIEIIAVDATESVPAASCAGDCLVTLDYSPLEPGVEENKYYAPGIGMILEVNLDTGERVELISYGEGFRNYRTPTYPHQEYLNPAQ